MSSKPDGAALLKTVLAASGAPRSTRWGNDDSLLRALLDAAPKVLRQRRRSTLFEAIHVLDLELPHSDFLAWLLDPFGPLTDNWLLRNLLERVAPEHSWDVDPTVEREVPVDDGTLDILITWPSFKLIIENKVWSPEGKKQIARYLLSAGISQPDEGRVVYLSPHGRMPRSVDAHDERVAAVSYRDLVRMLDDGLNARREADDRGKIFAQEFRNCILRLLNVRYDMTKPKISESTKIYLGNAERLAEIKSLAIDESAEFLQWMYSEAERRLRPLVGPDMVRHSGKYVVLFRLPDWKHDDFIFGLEISTDYDPTKRLISEPGKGPWVGIGAWRTDDAFDPKGCQTIVNDLLPSLKKGWPHEDDLRAPDGTMALWREIKIPDDGDIERWAEHVMKILEELATGLVPALKGVSRTYRKQMPR